MRLAAVGAVLLLAAAGAAVTGVLPLPALGDVAGRIWPILLFVVSITVVAELAAVAGLFDVLAFALARLARGRTRRLWIAVVALAVASTVFLSLDTTAVLLTPVVVTVARANGLPPLPFAFTTVWLANTGSLLLPVSNLTNLLAHDRLGGTPAEFAALMGPSALLAVLVPVLLLAALFRRELSGSHAPAEALRVADRTQLLVTGAVVAVVVPLLVSGIPPWIPATAGAVVLVAFFAWRSPRALGPGLLPWQLVVFATGLFLAVAVLEELGSGAVLLAAAGSGEDLVALWRLAGLGALSANLVDNLPAYLALETVADSPARLGALLGGVGAGPLITPWASLATLLWHARLTALGVDLPWRRFIAWGLVAAPLTVLVATVPLALLS